MPIYMEVPGAPGSVTEAGKWNSWIPLTGYQHGVDRGLAMEKGSMKIKAAAAPRLDTFTVMKDLEDSSMPLLDKAFHAESGVKVKIALTSEKAGNEYLLYELDDAVITSYDVSSSGDKPFEVLEFTYTKITATFMPHAKTHAGESKLVTQFDLTSS
jgi:type VI secretion system secreted protein Hcp